MILPWALTVAIAPADTEATQQTEVLVVETVGFSREEFTSELQLRLPQRKLLSVESPRPAGGFVYVHVTRAPPDVVRISIIEPDGRAYDRELPHEPNQEVRVATSAIATLLASVEHGELEPDREDVAIPGVDPAAATTEAEPESTEDVGSEEEPAAPPPRFEVGVVAHGLVGLGLVPVTDAGAYVGAGGGVGASLRLQSGALVSIDARGLRRVAEPFSIGRVRVSVSGGYDWRWKSFALTATAGVGVEPWWVRESGGAATLRYQGQPTNRRPLLGLVGTVTPAYIWQSEGAPLSVAVGPRLGFGGSVVFHDGAHAVRLDRASGGQSAGRLGGLELELGIAVTLWIPVRAPQSQPR